MINSVITLNSVEERLATFVAKSRYKNNRDKNIHNSKIGDQSDYLTDLNGFGAELAFSKLFNCYPDMSIFTRDASNDTGDVKLPNGMTVDVKTTTYPTGKLLAVIWKKNTVDLYALMIGSFPTYTFKGFMKSNELLVPERIGNLGHGETYIAKQHELYDI